MAETPSFEKVLEQGTAPFHIPEKIIGVELCANRFGLDRKNAMEALDALPEFEDLLSNKNFLLKASNASRYLSKDSRKVFSWQSDSLYQWKNLQLRRPNKFIAYLVAYGYASDRWTEADYPPMTDENKKKEEEKHKAQALKEEVLRIRKQETAVKRAALAERRKIAAQRIKEELGLLDAPSKKKQKKRKHITHVSDTEGLEEAEALVQLDV